MASITVIEQMIFDWIALIRLISQTNSKFSSPFTQEASSAHKRNRALALFQARLYIGCHSTALRSSELLITFYLINYLLQCISFF